MAPAPVLSLVSMTKLSGASRVAERSERASEGGPDPTRPTARGIPYSLHRRVREREGVREGTASKGKGRGGLGWEPTECISILESKGAPSPAQPQLGPRALR